MTSSENAHETERPIDIDEFSDAKVYSTPVQKSLDEIMKIDNEDESLRRYKEALLGKDSGGVVVDASNPKNVIVKTLSLIIDDNVVHSVDLPTPDDFTLPIKEGCVYKIRFEFFVQREIVSGLKYLHKVSRLGIGVTKEVYMLGSFRPSKEKHECNTPAEEAPSGMLNRGKYRVRSLITDDDKNRWMEWTWYLEITK